MEIVIENPTADTSIKSITAATTTGVSTTQPVNPLFATLPSHHRTCRTAYVTNTDAALSQNVDYYRTLQPQAPRTRHTSPEPLYDSNLPIATSVRRVDRSGLLEIPEPEPQRSNARARHSVTGADTTGHSSGTLTRRIDRSGLLEAVPEVPDTCQTWRNDKITNSMNFSTSEDVRSLAERKLTGAENDKMDETQNGRGQTSPRSSSRSLKDQTSQLAARRSSTETLASQEDKAESVRSLENRVTSPASMNHSQTTNNCVNATSTISSPYLRRYPGGSPTSNLERPTPVTLSLTDHEARSKNRNSFTCLSPSTNKFLPIDALPSRTRQSYVDLTGATYTRSSVTSPIGIITRSNAESTQTNFGDIVEISKNRQQQQQQQPDCLGRLSPRSRNERQSPLTMVSAIPDVIEAHGSRSHTRENDSGDTPEGERAEAEGCEHTAIESLEESRVSFKSTNNKILHNDNIQTLRVIILSEQL